MNFHVQDEWFEVVHHFLKELGVQYYSLPKYSPELNPAKLVFSKLKGCLQGKRQDSNLLIAILECLDKITIRNVIQYYIKRSYL